MKAIFLTTPELKAKYWQEARELLRPVINQACHGEFTLEDLDELTAKGHAITGVSIEQGISLCMVFEFVFYRRKTMLNIMAIGGKNLHKTADIFLGQLRQWALESGVTEIEACVSPAMARLLKPIGFKHTYDLVRMPC